VRHRGSIPSATWRSGQVGGEVAGELRTGYNAGVYLLFALFFHFFCTLFTIQSPNWNSKDEKNKFNEFEKLFQIRKSKKMI
jgi:hypothetical protein